MPRAPITALLAAALGALGALRAQPPGGWVPQRTAARAEFRSLSTAGAQVAWAGGKGGAYAVTADGGRTWRVDSVPGAARLFFTGAHAVSATAAYLLGTDFDGGLARIYSTSDGGRSWKQQWQMADSGTFMDGLACWSAERCVAFGDPVGGRFVVVTTASGGRTWTRVPAASVPAVLPGEAAFAASGAAIAVRPGGRAWIGTGGGALARVLRSADYGRTWTAAETPMPAGKTAGIFALAFRDALHGVAVGGDYGRPREGGSNVLATSDGGRTWRVVGSALPAGVRYGVSWLPGTRAYVAVGPSGSGRSDDEGRTWTPIDTVGFNTVRFVTPRIGWAAGVGGKIAKFRE
ncbi:MAG: WD40/YVTN/BNR-like repeat-containing protein [Gemmatimonadaceae bacterium]